MAEEPELSLKSLRAFLVVAEELHFGRAAERLHLTQPPLTRTIKALEAVLGVPLFERSTRRVRLTPAGEVLAVEARRLLADARVLRDRVLEAGEGRRRTVRLGAIESACMTRMPSVLSEFRRRFPDVHLHVSDVHSVDQLRRIAGHELDWGLVRAPVGQPPGLESAVAYDDPLVAVVRADAEVGPSMDLAALEGASIVLYDESLGPGFMSTVVAACARAGFAPRVVRKADSTAMLLSIVEEGVGVGIVSEAVSLMRADGVRFVPIENPVLSSPVLLVWRAGERGPELDALLDILRA